MFHRPRLQQSAWFAALFLAFILSGRSRAQTSDVAASALRTPAEVDTYPLVIIDRPGVLPTLGSLVTFEGQGSTSGSVMRLSLGLGIARDWELTGTISKSQSAMGDSEIGIGRLLYLAGPVELDGRIVLPIYPRESRFQDVSLGPAISYTHDSRWVLAGLSNLLHFTFSPETRLELPVEVSLGYQPWRRLYVYFATCLGEVGIRHAPSSTFLAQAAAEAGVIVAQGRTWDLGVTAANGNLWKASEDWSLSLLATMKSAR